MNDQGAMVYEPVDEPQLSAEPGSSVFSIVRKYASLADLLRLSGAIAVAVAMGLFLVDGVKELNDIYRFLSMLAFTAVLTLAGFAMSVLLKEQRGSRVFLGLSLLAIPVNFAVFGAMVYSLLPLDGMLQNYPSVAHWQVAGWNDLAIALVAGIAVLLPVVWVGFSALARPARGWLSASLLLSASALIIPFRQEIVMSVLAAVITMVVWQTIKRNSNDSLALRTAEGKFALALLFVPPLIMLGRGLLLYSATGVMAFMGSLGFYLVSRQYLHARCRQSPVNIDESIDDNSDEGGSGSATSAIVTVFASVCAVTIGLSSTELLYPYIQSSTANVIGFGVFLIAIKDLVSASPDRKLVTAIGVVGAAISTLSLSLLSVFSGDGLTIALCIATMIAMIVYGLREQYKVVVCIALMGLATIGVLHVDRVWSYAIHTGWWGIAALGSLTIVAGSLIDRSGTVVKKTPNGGV